MRSGKPAGTASQSRSSRRGGRCSSRLSPLSLSCVLPSFPISYQNKWIVVAPTWRVVRTYQCYPACPPDKSSVSFVVDRTHLCEQVAALRNLFVDSRHAGNSTNLRWIFLAPCLFFCCHAVVPRTRSVSRCLLLDWKEVICATRSCQGMVEIRGNLERKKQKKMATVVLTRVSHRLYITYYFIILITCCNKICSICLIYRWYAIIFSNL